MCVCVHIVVIRRRGKLATHILAIYNPEYITHVALDIPYEIHALNYYLPRGSRPPIFVTSSSLCSYILHADMCSEFYVDILISPRATEQNIHTKLLRHIHEGFHAKWTIFYFYGSTTVRAINLQGFSNPLFGYSVYWKYFIIFRNLTIASIFLLNQLGELLGDSGPSIFLLWELDERMGIRGDFDRLKNAIFLVFLWKWEVWIS